MSVTPFAPDAEVPWPEEKRVCRWCGGNGLNPFLPTRIRQFLTEGPYALYERQILNGEVRGATLFSDVNQWCPLNEWLEEVSAEVRGDRFVIATPFDLIGMSYHAVRCKRCRGTGRRARVPV